VLSAPRQAAFPGSGRLHSARGIARTCGNEDAQIDAGDRTTILVHYYRAMVGRADIWRMRLDATTNWAIGATAAVATLALGNASVPHYGVFIATLLTVCFLLLEARRLTFYHLWQQRVLLLERGLIAPAVVPGSEPAGLESLGLGLGRTVPSMSLGKAVARRLRRVYLFLFGAQLLAWLLKLASDPSPAEDLADLVARAGLGAVPGSVVLGLAVSVYAAGFLAARVWGGVERGPVESR
jgi:uncharacterized membrane protein